MSFRNQIITDGNVRGMLKRSQFTKEIEKALARSFGICRG